MDHEKGAPVPLDWHTDAYWRNRRLSPSQLQVHDVVLEASRSDGGTMLEMKEVLSSNILPELEDPDRLLKSISWDDATKSRNEQNHLKRLVTEYGWMNCLRGRGVQQAVLDPPDLRKCRWMWVYCVH
jgi:hypothetical protein